MEDSKQSEALSLEQFKQIMDKLSRLDNQMQEHFGNLTSEISILRHEMKQELDGVKKSLRDVEKSLEAAWDSINDIQAETKTHNDYKKTCQLSLDSHRQELDLLKSKPQKSWQSTSWNGKFENKAAWRTGENYCFGELL